MGKKKDLTGLKFNYLTVISASDERSPSNKRKWLCRCDCGTEKLIIGSSLISGNTISCGCKCHVIGDLVGKRFGKLVVVEMDAEKRNGVEIKWICKCDCGTIDSFAGADLKRGDTTSCGCYNATKNITHGMRYSTEYRCWQAMIGRCCNPNIKHYHCYGGRGIVVCNRWLNSFECFYADMGPRPSLKHSIDRFPDLNGNYEPSNCRWATPKQQMGNFRGNRWIEYNGTRMILEDWAHHLGTTRQSMNYHFKTKSESQTIEYFMSKAGLIA